MKITRIAKSIVILIKKYHICLIHVVILAGGYLLHVYSTDELYVILSLPLLFLTGALLSYFIQYYWWSWAVTLTAGQIFAFYYDPMLPQNTERFIGPIGLPLFVLLFALILLTSKQGLKYRNSHENKT